MSKHNRHTRGAAARKNDDLEVVKEVIEFAKRHGIGPGELSAAGDSDAAHELVAGQLGVSEEWTRRQIETLAGIMVIDFERIRHITAKFDAHRECHARRILPTILYPDEIRCVRYVHPVTGRSELRMLYFKCFKNRPHGLAIASIDEASGVQTLFNFIPISSARDLARQRRGVLVYSAKKAKGRERKE